MWCNLLAELQLTQHYRLSLPTTYATAGR